MERAIELVRDGACRVTDIGLELGYSDTDPSSAAARRGTAE